MYPPVNYYDVSFVILSNSTCLKQALTSSYQAKQEVTATNKSTTVEWSVSVPQQQKTCQAVVEYVEQ